MDYQNVSTIKHHRMFGDRLKGLADWRPPESWTRIVTLDMHTAGEPLRVLAAGYPEPSGRTVLERRRRMRDSLDHVRRTLMLEPRGHADMYGCVIVPPENTGSDFGVLFLHNEGYSTMCGHGIIAVSRAAVEMGVVARTGAETVLRIDSPAGTIVSTVGADGDVSFVNVPSFAALLDGTVSVHGLGDVGFDLGFGGAYYAYVDAASVGLALVPEEYARIVDFGRRIKSAVAAAVDIRHPEAADLGFLYGTIFVAPPVDERNDARNVCVFADGEVDRSPTGTGVSGLAAIRNARGRLPVGRTMTVESILGTIFDVSIEGEVDYFQRRAIVPRVSGTAYVVGRTEHFVDPADPLRFGFLLR